ncbi:MAG: glycerophosphodiester phosphodiesterase [Actinomycetota bacterium]
MRALSSRTRLVVAHRGASSSEPENTLAAFDSALSAGADAIEFDVRLTSDGVPVLMHDPDVSGATDGSGLVHEMSLAQVKRLDASAGRGPREEVPTLAEALALVGDRGGVDLEIKNIPGEPAFDSPEESVLMATLDALETESFDGPVLISSFNWLTIERSKELAPEIATGFLSVFAVEAHAALVYTRQHGHDFVLPQTPALLEAGEGLVDEAHRDGVRVGTWVADDPQTLETLFGWGVDAVASNDPALAIEVRRKFEGDQ